MPLTTAKMTTMPDSRRDQGLEGTPSPLHAVSPEGSYADWDEIYTDNVVRVYRLLYSKVGNRQDAEDLTTEVFLAALGPLRTSASRPEVRSYLARTAQTVLASFWRQRLGR